jgi:hypothetical protein
MAKTQLKGWCKPTIRRNQPVIKVGNYEREGTNLPSIVVRIRDTGRRFKLFMGLCHAINAAVDELDNGIYAVWCGNPEKLKEFFHQWWVEDAHWDHNVKVFGASGAGAKPKRIKEPRFVPTDKEGVKVLRKIAREDARHEGAAKPTEPRLHGDETLDKIEDQKIAEMQQAQEEWWGKMGMKPPKD